MFADDEPPPLVDNPPVVLTRSLLTLQDSWFQQDGKIDEMFPGLAGKDLQDFCKRVYILPNQPQRLPYFCPDTGARVALRHPLNQRPHSQVVEDYVGTIVKYGLFQEARSTAWGVTPTHGNVNTKYDKWLMGAGTTTDAVCLAHQRHSHNANVIGTIKEGLSFTEWNNKTPDSVLIFFKELHNSFHGGASTSFIELINSIPGTLPSNLIC